MQELPRAYNPKEVEDKIYKLWEESGFFTPEKTKKGLFQKKFVVTIAPPNITGELHIGHALENTLLDIVVRMKRMQGFETLWVPGIDHAAIGTQNVIEKELAKKGLTRHDLGREKFLEEFWKWKEKYGSKILEQFRKLGLSVDWSRTRFTMDENYTKAVYEVFNHYKNKGWIYQGYRVINWCPRCQSAISDLEVEYKETKGKLYFIKYPLADGNGFITVSTTRPETMLGDAAVAVNPSDERYKNLVGKKVILPIQNREIPVIADNSVDIHFGTGAVKVTPAHSVDDFEISQRHNLQVFEIIDKNAKMTKEAGPLCEGLTTKECREKVVEKLKELGLLEKTEELIHNVGHCERCGTIIEPLYSKQWFLKMKDLAELTKKAIQSGSVRIYPERWESDLINWLNNIHDWNISRQIWLGHPIPTAIPQQELPIDQVDRGSSMRSIGTSTSDSDDVLDTWFSAALWPFAVLGWPDKNHPDYKNYYPTDLISSAREIRYLWIIRMIFSGLEFTEKVPFKNAYIHPTVLTKEGRRMSKSLGTGIDPLVLIEKYGTDALRFGLAFQATGIQDMKFNEDVILTGKKFANKLWNIARYILTRVEGDWDDYYRLSINEISGSESFGGPMKTTAEKVTEYINQYRFGDAAHMIYDYMWHQIADKYIETTKEKNQSNEEEIRKNLVLYLINLLKLLHPFMPFITEEIWSKLPLRNKKLLLIEKWPSQ